jgi:hypothetical protein
MILQLLALEFQNNSTELHLHHIQEARCDAHFEGQIVWMQFLVAFLR